ncbi:hypothetical protein PMAYCL1PPCAC_10261, partial [Pristionchus mayeri]
NQLQPALCDSIDRLEGFFELFEKNRKIKFEGFSILDYLKEPNRLKPFPQSFLQYLHSELRTKKFNGMEVMHVYSHSGNPGNEKADRMARAEIGKGSSMQFIDARLILLISWPLVSKCGISAHSELTSIWMKMKTWIWMWINVVWPMICMIM